MFSSTSPAGTPTQIRSTAGLFLPPYVYKHKTDTPSVKKQENGGHTQEKCSREDGVLVYRRSGLQGSSLQEVWTTGVLVYRGPCLQGA